MIQSHGAPQRFLLALTLITLATGAGCSEDDPVGDDTVLVSGVVIDADRLTPAEGVRVTLLSDERIVSTEPTGTDGAYTMRVPRGTVFQTITDDFDPGTDDWYPMINVDYPGNTIMGPRDDLLIHACPTAGSFPKDDDDLPSGSGSIAAFDQYLSECNDLSFPQLSISSTEDANGIVVFYALGSVGKSCRETVDLSISLDDDKVEIVYQDGSKDWITPERDTCWMQPLSAGMKTDVSGTAFGFAGPGFSPGNVTLNIVDENVDRGLVYPSFDVPLRRDAITLVFAGRIDDQGGRLAVDPLCDCGGAPPGIVCD
jgi:hypothetical protein